VSVGGRRRVVWVLALMAVLALGFSRLRLDTDPLALLPQEVPAVAGLRLHQSVFPAGRELLITLRTDRAESTAAAAEAVAQRLSDHPGLARAVRWQTPGRADIAENIAWMWLQQSSETWAGLESRWNSEGWKMAIGAARERLATALDPLTLARAGYDPLGLLELPGLGSDAPGMGLDDAGFASADGLFRVVTVMPAREGMSYREAGRWLAEVRSEVTAAVSSVESLQGPVKTGFTGGPAFLSEVATGMESDLQTSVATTLLAIGVLFGLAHRSLRPLLLLAGALGLTLVLTIALGGLVLGRLNVVSCGFAAVMLGLVVDYGLVGFQELRAHGGEPVGAIRGRVFPGIAWSAVTTAGTFLSLGFTGLPGLGELGVLTAIGLAVGACVMLFGFLPWAAAGSVVMGVGAPADRIPVPLRALSGRARWTGTTLVVGLCAGVIAWKGWPRTAGGAEPLRPRNSTAYVAMAEVQKELAGPHRMTWLLFRGPDPGTVGEQMRRAAPVLERLEAEGVIRSHRLPLMFWPDPVAAARQREAAGRMASRKAEVQALLVKAGFRTNAFLLTGAVLGHWEKWSRTAVPEWPLNEGARWMSGWVGARTKEGGWVGLGTVTGETGTEALSGLPSEVWVAGWDRLGPELLDRVRGRVVWLTALLLAVLVGCLWLAFRRWSEVCLGLGTLALSFLVLLAGMDVLGAEWNLLNLVAVPLLLGTSVDSTIHVQLAMRRHGRDLRGVWRSTGMALVLCAGANIAGFASLAWSSNAGLASLDVVCAGGVLCVLAVSLGLLPGWWLALHAPTPDRPAGPVSGPSVLYGPLGWRLGASLASRLPRRGLLCFGAVLARTYGLLRPSRRAVVRANLEPVCGRQAGEMARVNLAEFGRKMVDLIRFEAGVSAVEWVREGGGWDAFREAMACRRGVLLVTVHLGNWELGTEVLSRLGVRPLVLTAPEPGRGLTEMRAAARARRGADTLVVGTDPFAFVEAIRRLQDGGVVALLLDRPVPGSEVVIEWFGRPFRASGAAAELVRATGCQILPVYVVREGDVYRSHALPCIAYDRSALRSREERVALSGRILRVFEPVIRHFPEQWFHFIPVWNDSERRS